MTIKLILAAASLLVASAAPALAQTRIDVPEPESLLLFGAGLAAAIALGVIRRRK